jgi:hypothetical protein
MMAVVHPLSRIFSPAVGGSQNVARVSSTITVEQSENKQSAKAYKKANKRHFQNNWRRSIVFKNNVTIHINYIF